ncbi:HAMP domain-containing sensor histidine kinase [Sphingomonas sp. SORGH_AS_0879]|uniref:sensor histidine kinase n=1 Tax=Sphingomonas sp. SORGH_AS_0879 TaxID=3041790 RepID=UPI0027813D64|nr:HAMP domain-containing sensor histidine kinase [Sphingomonas sp. SORGH_AS_0879]MDQ1231309.1 signal transduction histidine kinase [Sphingomonas sp. SORGH_AS_0879]
MIARLKAWGKRHWPRLALRTYLFASFFLVAALPGVGAVALRVYENTLVRQTEAELVAQGAALAASAGALWPAAVPERAVRRGGSVSPSPYGANATSVDLSATPILPERPAPVAAPPPAPDARQAEVRLTPMLADTRAATLASIILLDRDGRIVTGTARRGSYADLPEVEAALGGTPRTVLRRDGRYKAIYRFDWLSRAAATRVHHARPIWVDGRVVGVLLLSRSARSLFIGLYQDWGKIVIGVLAILGTLILLSGVLSRAIARPIEELQDASRDVAAGRGTVPAIPATAAIEIQDLYRDFAAMAQAIEARSHYLRNFAHAVSHEFKTPLTGIRGAIELLQDHGGTMSATERARFLANADADAQRLTLLVSRLLDLARADMGGAGANDASDAVATVRKLADAHRREDLTITVTAPSAAIPIALAAQTLEAVLTMLIENAAQAGADRLTIHVERGEPVVITIADNGGGIPPGDRERIFEPFFTSRRASGGTGLGLPIARALLVGAGGTLELVEGGTGTTMRLTLPGVT